MCPSITFSQFSLTKNQYVYMENDQFKHVKLYSESGLLCSWMTFSYSRVLFSNWNWLVCSSSVVSVMRIWGCERLSVSSKPVCGMAWQNTLICQSLCCPEVSFKAFVIKKKKNYLIFETLKCCPFCFLYSFIY